MEVKNILEKLRRLDEGAQDDFERREAIAKLKKLTSGDAYSDANHTYINPKTGAIIYSRDGSPMPAKSFNDPQYDTASVGLELRQLLKKVGLPVTADAKGNAMVDPAAFNNLGNDPEPKPPVVDPKPPVVDPKPPDVVVDPPKPPPPKPPPKPPGPGKNEVDPKDLARFQELVSKFKLVVNKKPKSIAEALMRDMGYGDEQINEWELFKPDSWFNNREYGDGTSRDDVRQQDAVKNIQGGVGSALVQNRTPLAPGSVASEEGSDGNTYAVNDKGLRTHRLDPGTQKWIEMPTSTPSENPELQPATVTDDPKPPPPKPPDPQPKPPDPQPKPPGPGKNEVDPKDLARFQELITKFKSVKPSDPKPQPPKPEPPNPQPAEEKKWPVTPDEIKAFQSSQEDPRQPGAKLKVDGMIGTHTYQALINAGYKPPADFNVTAYKPTGGGTAPKPKPKPEVQPTPPKRDWYDPRGWIGKESMSEDDQILSMIKGIKVK
jgi:hypothetical protein